MQTSNRFRPLTPAAARHAVCAAVLTLGLSVPALSQTTEPVAEEINLSGPRFGVTFLDDGIVEALRDRRIDVGSAVSQFGWQFEKRWISKEGGITAVTEWVALVGGLEQGVVLPSVSWMVGLRTTGGVEFGLGPNLTPAGPALVLAAGITFRTGSLNFPVNFAVVPSKSGMRFSVLTGFNRR